MFQSRRLSFFIRDIASAIFLTVLCLSCSRPEKYTVEGRTQGTTYHIVYLSSQNLNLDRGIDSLLKVIDFSMSTYNPESIISRVNRNDSTVKLDRHFIDVFRKSQEVSSRTDGYFDITVAPLINAYGFGFAKKSNVTQAVIDSLLQYIGYRKISLDGEKISKQNPNVTIDFNAIAQGYTVDVISKYLESRNIENYLVELGGEVKSGGVKEDGTPWNVGIDKPTEFEGSGLQAVVSLKDRSMATSGNYRRYYEENGLRFAHIVDPHTGLPGKHSLVSATVVADDCMSADAYATAFISMGMEKALQVLKTQPELNLQVFFVYDSAGQWRTYASEKLKSSIQYSE